MTRGILALAASGLIAWTCLGTVKDVDAKAQRQWLTHTLPLPHEIAISRENSVAPEDIRIRLPDAAGDIEKTAAAQLAEFLKDRTGVEPNGDKFEIIIGVLDAGGKVCGMEVESAKRLQDVPNRDQAYVIQPMGHDRLALAALNPKGVYYAAQTLKQLLAMKIRRDSVSVPLANVVDWPDMDQRGFWNVAYSTPGFISWLASLKLNFASFGVGVILKKGEKAQCPKLPMELIGAARNEAFLLMPHLAHFDYWWRYGRDELYPELVGKGDGAQNRCFAWGASYAKSRNPCMASPLLQRLIAEWIESAAEQGVSEYSIWLSETAAQCECETCLKDGRKQMVQETQAAIGAITAAASKYPGLQGRIFFTMGYENVLKDSQECLALLPPKIRAERVYGRNKAFDAFAAAGRWLVDYSGPTLGAAFFTNRYMCDAVKEDLQEHYDAKYSGLYCRARNNPSADVGGYWERAFGSYQSSAAAEWSWNAKGRDVRQFAEAWATVNGFAHPETFAEWIGIVRPVENLVGKWEDRSTAYWLKPPAKGEDGKAWTTRLPEVEELQAMLAACDQALPVAAKTEDESVLLENQYLKAFLQAMLQTRDLCRQRSDEHVHSPENVKRLQEVIQNLHQTIAQLDQLCDGLTKTPAVDPKCGPQQSKARHDRWTKSLLQTVDASSMAQ